MDDRNHPSEGRDRPSIKDAGCGGAKIAGERGKLLPLFNDFVSSPRNRADRFFPACLSPRIDVGNNHPV